MTGSPILFEPSLRRELTQMQLEVAHDQLGDVSIFHSAYRGGDGVLRSLTCVLRLRPSSSGSAGVTMATSSPTTVSAHLSAISWSSLKPSWAQVRRLVLLGVQADA